MSEVACHRAAIQGACRIVAKRFRTVRSTTAPCPRSARSKPRYPAGDSFETRFAMILLLLGLVLFLGVHSARFLFDGWRTRIIAERGEGAWKGLYSLVSLIGLVLIVIGYGQARQSPTLLWVPPAFLTPVNWVLMLAAFALLVAAYGPDNRLRTAVGHPMVLGVKVWALAHLLVNGMLADVLLFGSFVVWAIVDYAASRQRDRAEGMVRTAPSGAMAWLTPILGGIVLWAVFVFWAHRALIGVSPMGG